MAFELHSGPVFPGVAASPLGARQGVRLSASGPARGVIPVTATGAEFFGITGDATAAAGDAVRVYLEGNVVKAKAAASLGQNADVGVNSATDGFVPITGASGIAHQVVGKALEAAAAGQIFSLYVNPRQLGGLA
jgi:hypothetical protein